MPARIQIRPPRRERPLNLNETWQNVLEPAVQQIFKFQSGKTTEQLSFKVLYDSTYRLVTQGHGRAVHRKFTEATHNYLKSLPALNTKADPKYDDALSTDLLLEQVSELWQSFQVSLRLIGDIFMYLDRSFCNETGTPTTNQVGLQLFRDDVINESLETLFDHIIEEINQERKGRQINSQILRSVIDLLKRLTENELENSSTLYDTKFRNRYLENTMTIFEQCLRNIESDIASSQLAQIQKWLDCESRLGELYISEETRHEIIRRLETDVFDQGLARIFEDTEKSVTLWVSKDDFDTLRLASRLEARGPSRNLVPEISRIFARDQLEINLHYKSAADWIERTISLRCRYMRIADAIEQQAWENTFSRTHQIAIGELSEASNLLALYLDEFLKKNTSVSREQVEPALDNALIIYNCLNDRDNFSLTFQRLLARRLLNNSSRSREFEFSWLRRLKEEKLNPDSFNFERMIHNIDESRRLFYGSDSIAPGIIPTNVNVLSMHLWPKSMHPQVQSTPILPPEIAEAQSKFQAFYSSVKPDRTLRWNYGLSNVDVKIRVGNKSYLASVPLLCMSILSLFGGSECYTTKQIGELTNIPLGGELERHLKSLYIAPGSELLKKSPPGRDVNSNDSFTFNTEFNSSKARIKIKKVSASKSSHADKLDKSRKEDASILAQERAQKAEAAIIRIMKARKELSHAGLVQLTIYMLQQHFKAPPQLIKRAIQRLLSKGYIERSEADPQIYRYVA